MTILAKFLDSLKTINGCYARFRTPVAMPSGAEKARDFSEGCHNRLSALALSKVGEDPCGLKSEASSTATRLFEQRRATKGHGIEMSFTLAT
ncbi:MAG TPA: hypothetical protein VK967_03925 [Methylotenera sp.]|nr:hypothetical protein [Methylotenera sp.]